MTIYSEFCLSVFDPASATDKKAHRSAITRNLIFVRISSRTSQRCMETKETNELKFKSVITRQIGGVSERLRGQMYKLADTRTPRGVRRTLVSEYTVREVLGGSPRPGRGCWDVGQRLPLPHFGFRLTLHLSWWLYYIYTKFEHFACKELCFK